MRVPSASSPGSPFGRAKTNPVMYKLEVQAAEEFGNLALIKANSAFEMGANGTVFQIRANGSFGVFETALDKKALCKPIKDALLAPFLSAAARGGSFRTRDGKLITRPTCTAVLVDGQLIDVTRPAQTFATGGNVDVEVFILDFSPDDPRGAAGSEEHDGGGGGIQSVPDYSGFRSYPDKGVGSSNHSGSSMGSLWSSAGTVFCISVEHSDASFETTLDKRALKKPIRVALIAPFLTAAAKGGTFRGRDGKLITSPVCTGVTVDGNPADISRPAMAFATGQTVKVVVTVDGFEAPMDYA